MPKGATMAKEDAGTNQKIKGMGRRKTDNATSLHWLWGSAAIVLFDQVSKATVEAALPLHHTVELLPVFNLTLAHNPGAAFSLLAEAGGWQRWFFSGLALIVSVGLVAWLRRLHPGAISEALGITLILGGALGNLWDRIQFGYVIDFIQLHWHDWYFPAFNVADSAITIGAGLLILDTLFTHGTTDTKHG
ncbi:Lipoprotein signal peptidase [Gammaproteobacteria bacterium]